MNPPSPIYWGGACIAAFLLVDPILIEQVEYQLAKIQQNVRDKVVCQIIPRGLSCKIFGAFSYVRIKPNIWLAEHENRPRFPQIKSMVPLAARESTHPLTNVVCALVTANSILAKRAN